MCKGLEAGSWLIYLSPVANGIFGEQEERTLIEAGKGKAGVFRDQS